MIDIALPAKALHVRCKYATKNTLLSEQLLSLTGRAESWESLRWQKLGGIIRAVSSLGAAGGEPSAITTPAKPTWGSALGCSDPVSRAQLLSVKSQSGRTQCCRAWVIPAKFIGHLNSYARS